MPDIDNRSLSVCIQALLDAIRYYDLLCQSQTVDSEDYEEARYMYQLELNRLIEVYKAEEKAGKTTIPLAMLLNRAASNDAA